MPRLGSRDYVNEKDKFCMYEVMVGEKVNLPEAIFFYWLQAFMDKFYTKDKKNIVFLWNFVHPDHEEQGGRCVCVGTICRCHTT